MIRLTRAGGMSLWQFATMSGTLAVLALVAAVPGWGQAPSRNVAWRDVGLLVTGVVVVMSLDERVARDAASSHDGVRRNLAPFREFGAAPVFATVSAGVFLGGVLSGDRGVTRSGRRLMATAALAGGIVQISKYAFGRARPNALGGAWRFEPFSGATSLYSGHSTMAFAMATALSLELDRPVATLGLYSLASLTAMSRIADDRHWLSDVVAGAAIGIASAKFVYGDWTFFGVRAPRILTGGGQTEVGWELAF